ncbi:MAG TPA: tetratricopeptide repeat protein [Burkholderiaceae bacterium]|nr:tetratricopeptide repeat protein [Burkholderiaceae bacterium]
MSKMILFRWLIATLVAAASTLATAQDLDAARVAYEREDYDTAFRLYAPAAKNANAEAQYRLGLMYKFGWGADRDLKLAANWLRRAADQQHGEAQSELGVLYKLGRGVPKDAAEAARWFRRAADSGVGIAQLNLERAYKDGAGIKKDLSEAYVWFTIAASNGYADGFSYRARIAEGMSAEEVKSAERLAAERGKTITSKERK